MKPSTLATAALAAIAIFVPASAARAGEAAPAPATPTPAELRQRVAAMPRGDAVRGEQLYARQFCASCHGAQGATPSVNWPSIAGQRAAYTYKLLQDYRSALRHEG